MKDFEEIQSIENGILAKLFRKVIIETGLVFNIKSNVNTYILENIKYKRDGKPRSSVLGLINSGSMTWKSFVFLIYEILKIKKMTITVKLQHDNKGDVITNHEIFVTPNTRKEDFIKATEDLIKKEIKNSKEKEKDK